MSERAARLIQARKNLEAIQSALASNTSAGVSSVSIDGVSVSYSRDSLLTELRYWQKMVNRLSRSSNARTQGINLSSAHD